MNPGHGGRQVRPGTSNDVDPPTERTRAIRDRIAADTRRLRASTIALTLTVAAVVAFAVGIVVMLVLRA